MSMTVEKGLKYGFIYIPEHLESKHNRLSESVVVATDDKPSKITIDTVKCFVNKFVSIMFVSFQTSTSPTLLLDETVSRPPLSHTQIHNRFAIDC